MRTIIFCDIDGTLIDGFRGMFEISEKTKAAILALRKHADFILTSGRAKCMIPHSLYEVKPDGFIMNNGAYIEVHGKVLKNRYFTQEQIREVTAYSDRENNAYLLIHQKGVYTPDPDHPMTKELLSKLNVAKDVITTCRDGDYNFMVEICRNEESCDAFLHQFEGKLQIRRQYQYSAYDINDLRDGKGNAVKQVIDYLHGDAQAAFCFADSDNDLEMMEAVGYPIAMKNANAHIKQKAIYVCEDVLADGVYEGLIKMRLIDPLP